MASVVQRVIDQKLVQLYPTFVKSNVHYEVITGSYAYAVSGDTSDIDVLGFCIPPKSMIFPHLSGEILGFGKQNKRFENWQVHHIKDEEKNKQYDIDIFNIVKYFQLAMDNNPNVLDSLFVSQRCVLLCTAIGQMIRDNRKIFLHKGCYHRFRGYSYSQLHKCDTKNPDPGSKRYEDIQKHGFDSKFSYHVLRLLGECEQILTEGDLDLERDKDRLKAARRGEISLDQIKEIFHAKEKELEKIYHESNVIPYKPDEEKIKQLLIDCLEHHYGSLDKCIQLETSVEDNLNEIDNSILTIQKSLVKLKKSIRI